jgi:hypothetical protein
LELKTGVGVRVASGIDVGEMSDDGAGVGVESGGIDAVEHAANSAPTQRRISIRFCIRHYYSLKRGEGEIYDRRFFALQSVAALLPKITGFTGNSVGTFDGRVIYCKSIMRNWIWYQ